PGEPFAPAARKDERKEDERQEDGVTGADEHDHGDSEPHGCEASDRGRNPCAGDEEREEGETGREDRLARELVEHEGIARVEEQDGGNGERDPRAEGPRG